MPDEEWQEPDDGRPSATVIYGPRGERLRVWKEIGRRELGFRTSEDTEPDG